MRRLIDGIKWGVFALGFFVLAGCTIGRLRRLWRDLVERDIHPADTLQITWEDGRQMELSAYGSQVCCIYPGCTHCAGEGRIKGSMSGDMVCCPMCSGNTGYYQFVANWKEDVGLYVHEKRGKNADWSLVFRENDRILRSIVWVHTMRLLKRNLANVADRSEESMVTA